MRKTLSNYLSETNQTLTELEIAVLRNLVPQGYYDVYCEDESDGEDELHLGYFLVKSRSCPNMKEFMDWSILRGVVASLIKKGIISSIENTDDGDMIYDCIYTKLYLYDEAIGLAK